MIEGSSIREHAMVKPNLVGSLQRARFFIGFSILVNAVGTTLPSWWVSGIIDIVKEKIQWTMMNWLLYLKKLNSMQYLIKHSMSTSQRESSNESHILDSLSRQLNYYYLLFFLSDSLLTTLYLIFYLPHQVIAELEDLETTN